MAEEPRPAMSIASLEPSLQASRGLTTLLAQHAHLSALCDQIETVADELPSVCPERCCQVVERLETLSSGHHRLERDILNQLLAARDPELLARISRFNDEDEGVALEVAHALEPLVRGEAPAEPETLGYMLRCFFTSYRRSMLVSELAVRAMVPGARVSL